MNGCSTCGGRGAAGARPRARAGGSTCNGSLNFAVCFSLPSVALGKESLCRVPDI
jgi:hypothetical protein